MPESLETTSAAMVIIESPVPTIRTKHSALNISDEEMLNKLAEIWDMNFNAKNIAKVMNYDLLTIQTFLIKTFIDIEDQKIIEKLYQDGFNNAKNLAKVMEYDYDLMQIFVDVNYHQKSTNKVIKSTTVCDMTEEDVKSWFSSIGAWDLAEEMFTEHVDGSTLSLLPSVNDWDDSRSRLPDDFDEKWNDLMANGFLQDNVSSINNFVLSGLESSHYHFDLMGMWLEQSATCNDEPVFKHFSSDFYFWWDKEDGTWTIGPRWGIGNGNIESYIYSLNGKWYGFVNDTWEETPNLKIDMVNNFLLSGLESNHYHSDLMGMWLEQSEICNDEPVFKHFSSDFYYWWDKEDGTWTIGPKENIGNGSMECYIYLLNDVWYGFVNDRWEELPKLKMDLPWLKTSSKFQKLEEAKVEDTEVVEWFQVQEFEVVKMEDSDIHPQFFPTSLVHQNEDEYENFSEDKIIRRYSVCDKSARDKSDDISKYYDLDKIEDKKPISEDQGKFADGELISTIQEWKPYPSQ